MSSDRILLLLYFLLFFQFGSIQTAQAQLLPDEEVSAFNTVAENLGLLKSITNKTCNDTPSWDLFSDHGITCNCSSNTCHIETLSWGNRGLRGFLSPEVAKLTYLTELYLGGNKVHDIIPDSLGNMRWLYYLDLSNNQLTGEIPVSLGNLKAQFKRRVGTKYIRGINVIHAAGSSKTMGAVKACGQGQTYYECLGVPDCPSFSLDLSSNYLNGSIPENLGNITFDDFEKAKPNAYCDDFTISLQNNLLTGTIPKGLGDLKYLSRLYLSENQLSGSFPPELGNLTELKELTLQSNYFTGEFPSSFGQLVNLSSFSISGNYLTGPFPNVIANWTKIRELSFEGNNFQGGNIPLEIFKFSNVYSLKISDVANSSFIFPKSIALALDYRHTL